MVFENNLNYSREIKIDLANEFGTIFLNEFNPKDKAKVFGKTKLYYENIEYDAIIYSSTFSFHDPKEFLVFTDFPMHVIIQKNSERSVFQGALGFPFKFNNKNSSFIDKLLESKLISKKIFSFDACVDGRKKDCFMYLGGTPEEKKRGLVRHILPVDTRYNKWGINLKKVKIKYQGTDITFDEYINSDYAYINLFNDRLFVPDSFFTFLNSTFDKYYEESKCFYTDYGDTKYINCWYDDITDFPDLEFEFEGITLRLGFKELFKKLGDRNSYFIIQGNKFDKQKYFFFGYYLIEKYLIEFDYENKEIHIFTEENFNKNSNKNKYKISLTLILLSLGLNLISAIFLTIVKKSNIITR